jgi:hypothetical protein
MPQPRQFASERKYRADDHQHDADQYQRLTQASHGQIPHLL